MIFLSAIPAELLSGEQTNIKTYWANGKLVEGTVTEGKLSVSRVISTDPKDFLSGDFSPGKTYEEYTPTER